MTRTIFPASTLTALALAALAALAGCTSMAPRYERPASPIEQSQFRDVPAGLTSTADAAATDWREVFLDPRLQQVIAAALDNNRDLRVAVLNIEKARATYRIQRADLFPSVKATASGSKARSSTRTSASSASGSAISRSVSAEVAFSSWELDLFGRIRSLTDEALQTYLATEQTQRSTRMSLVAEVAGDWLTVGAYQQRLALAKQTLESQRKTLQLTEGQHRLGVTSGLDLNQVRTSVESARSDVASYTTSLAQARNALELVVGSRVDDALLPQADGNEAVALAPIPANLDSSVLLQRPDVLSAEHTLMAANADIGAARAAFFPTISLTASAGRSSDALSSLFDSGTRTWSFVPSISLPIFNAGSLKASLDSAKIEKEITIAEYEKAIQSAFSEVADALATRANIQEQLDAQRALVEVTGNSYTLSTARYRAGVDSYLDALDSQRSLYSAQQNLITLRLEEASNRVTLYKVFGGGADAKADQGEQTSQAQSEQAQTE